MNPPLSRPSFPPSLSRLEMFSALLKLFPCIMSDKLLAIWAFLLFHTLFFLCDSCIMILYLCKFSSI